MKTRSFVVVCLLALVTVAIDAQQQGQGQAQGQGVGVQRVTQPSGPPPTLVAEVQTMFNALKNNITRSADKMPEDKDGWSPTPDVEPGRLLSHIVTTTTVRASRWRVKRSGRRSTRAAKHRGRQGSEEVDIDRLLAESFARCDKAFAADAGEPDGASGQLSKIGALIYDTQHISEHYGNITYMRLQGMVPPSSAGRSQPRGRITDEATFVRVRRHCRRLLHAGTPPPPPAPPPSKGSRIAQEPA
jgi:hypothetical protein